MKIFYKFPFQLINFLILIPINLFLILKNSKTKNVFLQPEGGFGHTFTSPLLLNYYYKKNWVLFFGFNSKRHNPYVTKIFPNIIFLNTSLIPVSAEYFSKLSFKIYSFFLTKLLKKKVLFMQDYAHSLSPSHLNKDNDLLQKCFVRSKLFWIMSEPDFEYLDIRKIYNLNSDIEKMFFKKKKLLNFVIRRKDHKNQLDDTLRDTKNYFFYKDSFTKAIENGWEIMLSGDVNNIPEWILKNEKFHYYQKYDLDKNYFNFLSGVYSHTCIGPHSGALYYNIAKKNKCLILEHSYLGDSMPNCIVSYRKLNLVSKTNFKNNFLTYDFDEGSIYKDFYEYSLPLSSDDVSNIIVDFLKNYNNQNYGIDVKEIGINEGIFVDSNAKLSPIWVKENLNIKVN